MTAPAHIARGSGAWDEESVWAALTDFLQGWEVWPTCQEFARGGAKGLRDAVTRIHGPEWWANEFNLPGGDRQQGGVRRWTEEAIRATLHEFLNGRPDWPKNREFDEAGLHAFREALRHYGGPRRWSVEMGVTWKPRRTAQLRAAPRRSTATVRDWPKWTERTIEAELRTFLAGRDAWPKWVEFVENGRKGLYQAVLKHGGTRYWAARMGVTWITRNRGHGQNWTEERIHERLAAFLAGTTKWPGNSQFADAGERGLLQAIRRRGGIDHWAEVFGLEAPPSTSARRGGRRHWTDERIAAAIEPLVDELGRWPTKSEFRHAGLSSALSAVYDHGGSRRWQKRLGVQPSDFNGPLPARRHWSRNVVEAELRGFCGERRDWPTYTEFRAANKGDLYHAIARHGGARFWRERLGLPMQATHEREDPATS